MHILIAISDPVKRDTIKYVIHDSWDDQDNLPLIDDAGSVSEARQKLLAFPDYDLLICHSHLVPSPREQAPAETTPGLAFLQELDNANSTIPAILLSFDGGLFRKIQLLKQAGLVLYGQESTDADLVELIKTLLGKKGKTHETQEKYGKIDVTLRPGAGQSTYIMEGVGFKFKTDSEPLQIDMDEINELILHSSQVGEVKQWRDLLKLIGRKVLKRLFANSNFREDYHNLVDRADGEENIRLRFIVNEEIYPVALEAILNDGNNHLMLHTRVFRSLCGMQRNLRGQEILFVDNIEHRPPVNCLIIAANAFGTVTLDDGKKLTLDPLTQVVKEAKSLYTFLKENKQEFGIERIALVPQYENLSFEEDLNKQLESGRWDLIHYAGHSYYDQNLGKGYFFYPGDTGPIAKESERFSQSLRFRNKTQLIYLSSCESSGSDFVLSLAHQLIPAIIGFRWEIEDNAAADHADTFYRKLFQEKKTLPEAFLETRREMYENDEYKDNRIWAAGMLIIQGG